MLEMLLPKKSGGPPGVANDSIVSQIGTPVPARYISMVYLDGYLYTFGGQNAANGANNQTWRMNVLTRTWERRADMLNSSQRWAATVHNGKIVAIYGAASYATYDPVANTWTNTFTGSSFSPQWGELFSWNGDLYTVGGNDTNGVVPLVKKLVAGVWQGVGTMPGVRTVSACLIGDDVIVAGGQNGASASLSDVFAYNLVSNTVRDLQPLKLNGANDPLYFSKTLAWKGKAYTMGGSSGGTDTRSSVYETDPVTGATKLIFNLSQPRRMFGAASVPDDAMYVYSGTVGSPIVDTMYRVF